MRRTVKIISSLFCMFLMINMINIEATNNSLIIHADLRIIDEKDFWDINEEILFDASFTTGP